MSHTPHELAEDFPGQNDRIHALKLSSAHFAKLVEDYHDVNREVHRAETGVTPMDQAHETELRKKRSHLKDQIARALSAA
ncbi:MAG: YdcH family protein [Paracoccaceae bacterium]